MMNFTYVMPLENILPCSFFLDSMSSYGHCAEHSSSHGATMFHIKFERALNMNQLSTIEATVVLHLEGCIQDRFLVKHIDETK